MLDRYLLISGGQEIGVEGERTARGPGDHADLTGEIWHVNGGDAS
jgi:hypothetical protein